MPSLIEMIRNRRNRETLYCTPEYWDSKTDVHQDHSVSMWPNNHLNRFYHTEVLDNIERFLPDVKNKVILDVGCGTGRLSRYFVEKGAKVLGFDFSTKSIDIAKKQSQKENPAYLVQSVFDLIDEQAYDIIVAWGTVTIACQNKQELIQVLKRLFTALKNGGQILLMEPVHKGFLHRVLDMNIREFCQIMEEAGFHIQEVRHLHCWPFRLGLAFWNWPKWLTAVGYFAGEGILYLTRHRALGDYQSIFAVK